MTQQIDHIRSRIRALRAKASDAAATEAEAMAAAEMAARLAEKYDIAEAEAGFPVVEGVDYAFASAKHPVASMIGEAIAALTETRVFMAPGPMLMFAGAPVDLDLAVFLAEMLPPACDRAAFAAWAVKGGVIGKQMFLDGFMVGFSVRVSERLRELADSRKDARREATGRDLIVVKAALIAQKLEADGVTTRERAKSRKAIDADGFIAGHRAGSKVGLGRPVEGKDDQTRIGGAA